MEQAESQEFEVAVGPVKNGRDQDRGIEETDDNGVSNARADTQCHEGWRLCAPSARSRSKISVAAPEGGCECRISQCTPPKPQHQPGEFPSPTNAEVDQRQTTRQPSTGFRGSCRTGRAQNGEREPGRGRDRPGSRAARPSRSSRIKEFGKDVGLDEGVQEVEPWQRHERDERNHRERSQTGRRERSAAAAWVAGRPSMATTNQAEKECSRQASRRITPCRRCRPTPTYRDPLPKSDFGRPAFRPDNSAVRVVCGEDTGATDDGYGRVY